MNFIRYIFAYIFGFVLLSLAACTSEDFSEVGSLRNEFTYIDGDKVVVNISVEAPELKEINTRAFTEKPDYNDLHLYLVEFDDNGSPLLNTFKTVYTPESETPSTDKVVYKVVLNQSDKPRILHLIALPKEENLNVEYGIEATIMPNLKTANQTPAYWHRLTFPSGYVQEVDGKVTHTKELDQLKHVALIRNYACITMTTKEGSGFTLTGFAIVNNPESGTMVPWNSSSYSFPDFLNKSESEDKNQKPLEFSTLSASYSGIVPSGLTFSNQEANLVEENNIADTTPKYMYERPFNSIRHTYIMIKGHREGEADSYYKLDIGKNDGNGIFRYYNILRNYKYNIVLNNVAAKGYASIEEAVKGVVYNNFSFDIELNSMLNISDGEEIVYVNFTTAVLTDPSEKTLDFRYRYRRVDSNPPYKNDNVTFIGLEKGDVIKEVEQSTNDDANGWREIKITCHAAQTETKTQSFTIVKSSGLGRTINLILHRKWTMTNVKEFPGTLENWDTNTSGSGTAGDKAGDDLTIFFDIPDNLQESMFPLVFTLEADRQNIENNPLGMLVVNYGTSGFKNITGRRIKYEKSVSWTQYNDPLKANDPYDNGTAIDNGDGTKIHRVRCRFRTITDLENFTFDESETQVLITNDNFNDEIVTFTRGQQTTNP